MRMWAVVLDEFGGPERLQLRQVPVPSVDAHEVLIQVDAAGLGEWDIFEREGGYARMSGQTPQFPYILGSEGAGIVAAVGAHVTRVKPGDSVYASSFLNRKGGFYAEYAVVHEEFVLSRPLEWTVEQAAVASGVGVTALRGLHDVLKVQRGESLLVFGASGGIGHLAMQLGRCLGARVLAVASGADGVAFARTLGADHVVDGRIDALEDGLRKCEPDGVDVVLLTAGGEKASAALSALREGGRAAHPNGIAPLDSDGVLRPIAFNADPDHNLIRRFDRLAVKCALQVHVSRTFALSEAAAAHEALRNHHLGKMVLRIHG